MRASSHEQIILDPSADPEAEFTATAATDIITSAAHGLSNGTCIQVSNSGGALPGGLSASTNYYVINATTNTFQVSTVPAGSAVNITSAGTGTHTYRLKGKAVFIGDWRHNVLHLTFSTSPTMTIKVQGSISEDIPDFNAAQSPTNKWDYIEVIDIQDGTAIDGDTGVACSGSADNRVLELNVDGLQWVTVNITSATAVGNVGVSIRSYNEA
jgi:hypothetical protein